MKSHIVLPPVSPADRSWWIGVSPETFTARAWDEVPRMRRGRRASAVMGAEPQVPDLSRPKRKVPTAWFLGEAICGVN